MIEDKFIEITIKVKEKQLKKVKTQMSIVNEINNKTVVLTALSHIATKGK